MPELIGFRALCRIQNLGVDPGRKLLFLREQLSQGRTLAGGHVLDLALVWCTVLECERIHLFLF